MDSDETDIWRRLYRAAGEGDLAAVQRLNPSWVRPNTHPGDALCMAARSGHLEVVRYLLSLNFREKEALSDTQALKEATAQGQLEVVDLLLTHFHTPEAKQAALKEAAIAGHLALVERLLIQDPKGAEGNNEALYQAAQAGHLDCVQALIPYSDPRAHEAQPLMWAIEGRHLTVIQALIPVSSPVPDKALLVAIRVGNVTVVQSLLAITPLDLINTKGLQIAAQKGTLEVVQAVLAASDASRDAYTQALVLSAELKRGAAILGAIAPHADVEAAGMTLITRKNLNSLDQLVDYATPATRRVWTDQIFAQILPHLTERQRIDDREAALDQRPKRATSGRRLRS